MKRRDFIIKNGIAATGLSVLPSISLASDGLATDEKYVSNRPPKNKRTFTSTAIENEIKSIKKKIADDELAWLFENCYPNTLDTTVDYEVIDGKPDTFIITGDIDAMWLRDSTAQVWPYMSLINKDEGIKKLVAGLINRQVKCILKDPYANAFYKDLTKESHWKSDQPSPISGVHERKWEIDSLCYVVRLSEGYYRATGDASIFDSDWDEAMRTVYDVLRTEQRKDGESPYRFKRVSYGMIDAPVFDGTGRPIKPVGLIVSAFRPSDDATMYPFLIPSNIFAAISLRQLHGLYTNVRKEPAFASDCLAFANEVDAAIKQYAIAEHLDFGQIYAYEVDGFGNKLYMDDANVPSLMSLAYLDDQYKSDPIYTNTRNFLLSENNPYFLKGTAAEGQASPHTGKEKIWPMGIILRAMTSTDDQEITNCLKMLKATHADTGFMHEAFHKDDPTDFNRSWFAWANTLFGELIVKIHTERPHLLKQTF
ncbi:glycoside hydrolase family 125 protein [Reichenbachiella carrageenanivorans]|uniref:Glycoside hydrolase family 125 protein n=1 Tax=Reichenbachiella carrageenanivorans TaxID=2979869 RepID=A0ABY6D4E3_9BACT|nr:glycoside hydrolase family 125 protein [Reichenbachiella carrageenanivorans]UXX81022.1 glycoside hydrolase family 125 protein [Reichenbachiella carrageenanivorans]